MPFKPHFASMASVHISYRAINQHWFLETNSLHTPQGEVSISLLNIHVFLRLLFSGLLYDEVLPLSKDFKTTLRRSCTHLFTNYHILKCWLDHKLTIEEWIVLWFYRTSKYYAPTRLRQRDWVPFPDNISYIANGETCGWDNSHAVFDELLVRTGEWTKTFLTAFISC